MTPLYSNTPAWLEQWIWLGLAPWLTMVAVTAGWVIRRARGRRASRSTPARNAAPPQRDRMPA